MNSWPLWSARYFPPRRHRVWQRHKGSRGEDPPPDHLVPVHPRKEQRKYRWIRIYEDAWSPAVSWLSKKKRSLDINNNASTTLLNEYNASKTDGPIQKEDKSAEMILKHKYKIMGSVFTDLPATAKTKYTAGYGPDGAAHPQPRLPLAARVRRSGPQNARALMWLGSEESTRSKSTSNIVLEKPDSAWSWILCSPATAGMPSIPTFSNN